MFYEFLYPLGDEHIFFNVFRYITFRSAMAAVTAFLICVIFGPWIIRCLKRIRAVGSTKRPHAEEIHGFYKDKKETPTMGGILILVSIVFALLLWMDLHNSFTLILFVATVWLGILGGLDDYLKMKHKNSKGLRARKKFRFQLLFAALLGLYLLWPAFSECVHHGNWFTPPIAKGGQKVFSTQTAQLLKK